MIGRRAQKTKWRAEIRQLKAKLRQDPSLASNNIAATYRQLGDFRRAFHWWKKTTAYDADAWVEIGYSLQYGIGVRKDTVAAIKAYRRALKATMSEFREEETHYLLAVALLDRANARDAAEIRHLLTVAAEDGDYPHASGLLQQLAERKALTICRCRRGLARRLGGNRSCALHSSS